MGYENCGKSPRTLLFGSKQLKLSLSFSKVIKKSTEGRELQTFEAKTIYNLFIHVKQYNVPISIINKKQIPIYKINSYAHVSTNNFD